MMSLTVSNLGLLLALLVLSSLSYANASENCDRYVCCLECECCSDGTYWNGEKCSTIPGMVQTDCPPPNPHICVRPSCVEYECCDYNNNTIFDEDSCKCRNATEVEACNCTLNATKETFSRGQPDREKYNKDDDGKERMCETAKVETEYTLEDKCKCVDNKCTGRKTLKIILLYFTTGRKTPMTVHLSAPIRCEKPEVEPEKIKFSRDDLPNKPYFEVTVERNDKGNCDLEFIISGKMNENVSDKKQADEHHPWNQLDFVEAKGQNDEIRNLWRKVTEGKSAFPPCTEP